MPSTLATHLLPMQLLPLRERHILFIIQRFSVVYIYSFCVKELAHTSAVSTVWKKAEVGLISLTIRLQQD